jgi:hypothetical protein
MAQAVVIVVQPRRALGLQAHRLLLLPLQRVLLV